MNNLIKKYDIKGPRYTSYPPVPFWNGAPNEQTWLSHIERSYEESEGIDLYIHIPYCEKLCYYCGCNRTISKNKKLSTVYTEMILDEWSLYKRKLSVDLKIRTIHFGGGTPTYLSPLDFENLLGELSVFFTNDFRGSIEIDPRTCKEEHLQVLKKYSINRISMGIQDFDPQVQKIINREQSFDLVEKLIFQMREYGFESINFDLIYGLPGQTTQTISDTIEKVIKLDPDMIAFYSYAHLPERIKNQKLLPNELIPFGDKKRELYEIGKEKLINSSMEEIGLDHFAKKSNYLCKVKREGKLLRNFMGYTDKKSSVLLGLGVTSISNTPFSFAQNEKEIKEYKHALEEGVLPLFHGHIQSQYDQLIERIIQDIMCNEKASFEEISEYPHIDKVIFELDQMQKDGLLLLETMAKKIKVLPRGRTFLRNIAMCFDSYLRERKENNFSRTI